MYLEIAPQLQGVAPQFLKWGAVLHLKKNFRTDCKCNVTRAVRIGGVRVWNISLWTCGWMYASFMHAQRMERQRIKVHVVYLVIFIKELRRNLFPDYLAKNRVSPWLGSLSFRCLVSHLVKVLWQIASSTKLLFDSQSSAHVINQQCNTHSTVHSGNAANDVIFEKKSNWEVTFCDEPMFWLILAWTKLIQRIIFYQFNHVSIKISK